MAEEKDLEWICKQNRTGIVITDIPEIADSGLGLYEIKMRLNSCINCNDYVSYNGNSYCLKEVDKNE